MRDDMPRAASAIFADDAFREVPPASRYADTFSAADARMLCHARCLMPRYAFDGDADFID